MIYVINTLAPIALLILCGALLRRFRFAPAVFFNGINRLVYWVALPALLLDKTSQPLVSGAEAIRMFGLLVTVTLACVLLGYLATWRLRIPSGSVGAFVQGAFRGNLAYIGLPVVMFSLEGAPSDIALAIGAASVLALAPLIPIYNIIAVLVLVFGATSRDAARTTRASILLITRNILTNPLLLACAAGLWLAMSGIALPLFARRGLTAMGQMALPLSLIAIGASLTLVRANHRMSHVLGAASIKILIAPFLGWLLGPWFGLAGLSLRAALIFLACPTAVVSYVMADQLGNDAELAGRIVLFTTLLAFPGLAMALLLT